MKITILGSCRQKPLSKYFTVTSIQDSLTYPHYTKEIIQAIEYIKGSSSITSEESQVCFRTGILQHAPIINQFQQEFNDTDLFVIEIASRISYQWNQRYVHHIATEEQYGCREHIVQCELTDEEIEKDLCQIKELLSPKKILIVSHLYTYESGKRYELIKLLERLCIKYELPFLSPSTYLMYETDVYQKEAVLSHYTEKGEQQIAQIYKNYINDLYKPKTVVLVLKNKYCNYVQTDRDAFWGIGDMIRTMYGMYRKSLHSNYRLLIDLSHHPISKYIIHHDHSYSRHLSTIIDTIHLIPNPDIDYYIKIQSDPVIFMGAHCALESYDPCEHEIDIQLFVKKHICPTSEFMDFFNHKNIIGNVSDKHLIHYRIGDDEIVRNTINADKINQYYEHFLKQPLHHILLSDSPTFKQYVKQKGQQIVIFDHEITHLGYDRDDDKIKNSLFEYFLATKVKQITSYSVYGWISGFIHSIHKVFNVPIQHYMNVIMP